MILCCQQRYADVCPCGHHLHFAVLGTVKREPVLCNVAGACCGSPGGVLCTSEHVPHLLSPNHCSRWLIHRACVEGERLMWVPEAQCAQSLKHGLVFPGCDLKAPHLPSVAAHCATQQRNPNYSLQEQSPSLAAFSAIPRPPGCLTTEMTKCKEALEKPPG